MNILLVEDNEETASFVLRGLEEAGCTVTLETCSIGVGQIIRNYGHAHLLSVKTGF